MGNFCHKAKWSGQLFQEAQNPISSATCPFGNPQACFAALITKSPPLSPFHYLDTTACSTVSERESRGYLWGAWLRRPSERAPKATKASSHSCREYCWCDVFPAPLISRPCDSLGSKSICLNPRACKPTQSCPLHRTRSHYVLSNDRNFNTARALLLTAPVSSDARDWTGEAHLVMYKFFGHNSWRWKETLPAPAQKLEVSLLRFYTSLSNYWAANWSLISFWLATPWRLQPCPAKQQTPR